MVFIMRNKDKEYHDVLLGNLERTKERDMEFFGEGKR